MDDTGPDDDTPAGPSPGSSASGAADRSAGPCDSCGGHDDRLEPVHRVYLDLDELGRVCDTTVLPDVEWWCPACRATYPNDAVADAAGP